MSATHYDKLRCLAEQLKVDVESMKNDKSKVFLDIWGTIERRIFVEHMDFRAIIDPDCVLDLAVRDGVVDIGRHYMSRSSLLPHNQKIAADWISIGAEWGSFMGQLLLLKMDIDSGKTDYDPRWLSAYNYWKEQESIHSSMWHTHKRRFDERIYDIVFELGFRSVIHFKDVHLLEDVNAEIQHTRYNDLPLTSLRWQAEKLLTSIAPKYRNSKTVLYSITPGNDNKENQSLSRFNSLMNPIEVKEWPTSTANDWLNDLDTRYPWMGNVTAKIFKEFTLQSFTGHRSLTFKPLLLVGEPGLGKSHFVRSLGAALGLPTAFLMMAGMNDNMMLKGAARGWGSARAGYLVEFMLENQCANPLVCLDEIEKIGTSTHNGRLWETLLAMLEPATSKNITDEYLLGRVDYSSVNWIATANDISGLPEPLLSRFTVIKIGTPKGEDFDVIYSGILSSIAHELNTETWALPQLDGDVVSALRQQFESNTGSLRKMTETVRHLLQIEATAQKEQRSTYMQ